MAKSKNYKTKNPPVEEFYDIEPEPEETIIGIVTDCMKLNIRVEPSVDASVICEVPALSKLMIDRSKSTGDWWSVCTETGIEGFCMKKFVMTCK